MTINRIIDVDQEMIELVNQEDQRRWQRLIQESDELLELSRCGIKEDDNERDSN